MSPTSTRRATASNKGRRPRIGIDLHVVDGIFQGSRTHCLELFSRIFAITPECDFLIFAASEEPLVAFSENFRLPNVTLVPMPNRSAPSRLLLQLPWLAKKNKLDLLHTQYITPPVSPCPTAVTVHDILFESRPEFFDRSFILRSRTLVPLSVRRSAMVFTVSEFSAREICGTYKTPQEKIVTIFNGVDTARFFAKAPESRNADDSPISSLGLKGRDYLLTVGRLEPRKNHANLFRAWSLLSVPRPALVVVGQPHFGYTEAIDLISSLGLNQDVVLLEGVTDEQLPCVYRNAKGFVYASWAEGFGMPLLEAMASGVPVITSANTALAEVSAGATLQVDPGNPKEIADAIRSLLRDPGLGSELSEKGLQRSKDYSWNQSAAIVRTAYLRYFGL